MAKIESASITDMEVVVDLNARRNAFIQVGYSQEWVDTLQKWRPTLYAPSVLSSHLSGLRERGFANPNKMIESLPAILGYAFENIDAKLGLLRRIINLYNLPFTA